MDTSPPTVIVAELEAITPQSKPKNELSAGSTAMPKVIVVDDGEKEKVKEAKLKDPAVLVNVPSSPSAHAYETTQHAKADGEYFDPIFVEQDAGNLLTNSDHK